MMQKLIIKCFTLSVVYTFIVIYCNLNGMTKWETFYICLASGLATIFLGFLAKFFINITKDIRFKKMIKRRHKGKLPPEPDNSIEYNFENPKEKMIWEEFQKYRFALDEYARGDRSVKSTKNVLSYFEKAISMYENKKSKIKDGYVSNEQAFGLSYYITRINQIEGLIYEVEGMFLN